LRTYPRHLKVRLTRRDKEMQASHDPSRVGHVSIAPESRYAE